MDGLMMDFQLTLPPVLRRAETYFGEQEVVTRMPDRSFHTYTFRDMAPTSNWGIQWTDTGPYTCSGDKFLNNTYTPNAPTAWQANTPPRFECNLKPDGVPTEVAGNTFELGPNSLDCARSKTKCKTRSTWPNRASLAPGA